MNFKEAKREEARFPLLKLKKGQFLRANKTSPIKLKCLKSLRKNLLIKIPSKSSCHTQKQTKSIKNLSRFNLLAV